uniref:Uncharacterized protein n=1 Tax=Alexandrium monilatum TaxID=311494 RepID=A0A7S4RKI1_9DINO
MPGSSAGRSSERERPERKPEVPDNVWPSPPGLVLCNSSLPVPMVVFRTWDLPDGWRRVYEKKNSKDACRARRDCVAVQATRSTSASTWSSRRSAGRSSTWSRRSGALQGGSAHLLTAAEGRRFRPALLRCHRQ